MTNQIYFASDIGAANTAIEAVAQESTSGEAATINATANIGLSAQTVALEAAAMQPGVDRAINGENNVIDGGDAQGCLFAGNGATDLAIKNVVAQGGLFVGADQQFWLHGRRGRFARNCSRERHAMTGSAASGSRRFRPRIAGRTAQRNASIRRRLRRRIAPTPSSLGSRHKTIIRSTA